MGDAITLDNLQVVTTPNSAPVLLPTHPTLPTIQSLITSDANTGSIVSDLVGGISDADPGAKQGIAIVGTDTTYGTFQFSLDNGEDWYTINAASDSNALVLPAAGRMRALRPQRHCPKYGERRDHFPRRDQTTGLDGVEGEYVDCSVNGGALPSAQRRISWASGPCRPSPVSVRRRVPWLAA